MRRLVAGLVVVASTSVGLPAMAASSHTPTSATATAATALSPDVPRQVDRVAILRGPGHPRDIVSAPGHGGRDLAVPRSASLPSAKSACLSSAPICIHYTTTGSNAVTASYLQQVEDTVSHVAAVYLAAGYRRPEPDAPGGARANPDTKLDIYLTQLAGDNDYGYCQTAAPQHPQGSDDTSAFCVLDNNYTDAIYSAQTPVHDLQVTVAHEYFHAVQFGYDAAEDSWFMEATATWAEDEIYTGINDNRQFLPYGPLGRPGIPLDSNSGLHMYGDWLFFRYLTERYPGKAGLLPTLVRQMWQRADSTRGPDQYSIQAVASVLSSRGTSLATQYANFSDANRHPGTSYSEGRAYRVVRPAESLTIDRAHPRRTGSRTMAHLTALTERFRRLTGAGTRLRLRLTTTLGASTAARVSSWHADGTVTTARLLIHGDSGRVTVRFGPAIQRVELTIVNGSDAERCWTSGDYSCEGTPRHDNVRMTWSAQALR